MVPREDQPMLRVSSQSTPSSRPGRPKAGPDCENRHQLCRLSRDTTLPLGEGLVLFPREDHYHMPRSSLSQVIPSSRAGSPGVGPDCEKLPTNARAFSRFIPTSRSVRPGAGLTREESSNQCSECPHSQHHRLGLGDRELVLTARNINHHCCLLRDKALPL